jgi:peptidoglycan/LPS O-acetylase OafA/YrhL
VTRGLSLYLDAVRFLAAAVVLLSHFAYVRFTGGGYIWIRELNLGSDAVVLFFVLSGFVIAYTADTKDTVLSRFLFNRATRIYSVAVPAVAITLLLDAIGSRLDPTAYDGWWYASADPVGRAVRALTFTNELWFNHVRIGTNGPYWSLAYEVWYYALFAAAFFLSGARRVLVLLLVGLIMGPKILLLCPAWWLGVWAYRRVKSGVEWPRALAWAGAIAPVAVYALCLAGDVPPLLLGTTEAALGPGFVAVALKFSNEFVWNTIIAALAALHFVAVAALYRARVGAARGGAAIRWLAGATFSLYLVHYPTLQFFDALLPAMESAARDLALLAATVALCLAFAALFERTLPQQRAALHALSARASRYRSAHNHRVRLAARR